MASSTSSICGRRERVYIRGRTVLVGGVSGRSASHMSCVVISTIGLGIGRGGEGFVLVGGRVRENCVPHVICGDVEGCQGRRAVSFSLLSCQHWGDVLDCAGWGGVRENGFPHVLRGDVKGCQGRRAVGFSLLLNCRHWGDVLVDVRSSIVQV